MPTTAQHSQIRTPQKFSSYGELSESESEPEPVDENAFDPAATVGVAEVNHSDLDAQMLTSHLNEQFAPVVRSLVDNFIDVKLRMLKVRLILQVFCFIITGFIFVDWRIIFKRSL